MHLLEFDFVLIAFLQIMMENLVLYETLVGSLLVNSFYLKRSLAIFGWRLLN